METTPTEDQPAVLVLHHPSQDGPTGGDPTAPPWLSRPSFPIGDYTLIRAVTRGEAMQHLAQRDFAVVVIDLSTHAADGLKTATLIREADRQRDVPILFLGPVGAGLSEPILYRNRSADDYLPRPFGQSAFLRRIEMYVRVYAETRGLKQEARTLLESQANLEFLVHQLQCVNLQLGQEMEQRRQAEQLARDGEQRFLSLLHATGHWVWEVDRNGVYTYVSPNLRELLGVAPHTILGHKPAALLPSTIAATLQAIFDGIDTRTGFDYRFDRADGTQRTMETQVVPVRDEEGRVVGFRGVDRDVTKRWAMQRQAMQSGKMQALGHLTAEIVHDFNNILTVIQGNLRLVRKDVGVNRCSEGLEFLDDALSATRDAAQLVSRLAQFSMPGSSQPELTSVQHLINAAERLIKRSIGTGTGIVVEVRCAENLMVLVDASQFVNALLNLAINARDAMPDGGRLVVAVVRDQIDADQASAGPDQGAADSIRVSVIDTGRGMPPDVVARAIDPFFTTKPRGKGCGLGLSTVYGFVRQSGGTLQIDSVEGKGTTVNLWLPVVH